MKIEKESSHVKQLIDNAFRKLFFNMTHDSQVPDWLFALLWLLEHLMLISPILMLEFYGTDLKLVWNGASYFSVSRILSQYLQ